MSVDFLIAATFTASLCRLQAAEQKAAKTTAFDLQLDPSGPGLKFHRIERSRDPHFWSIRVNGDIRIIIHKTEASFLLAYVGHHDDAYTWAERRRIEAHPRTGAIQIVEVRERVEDIQTAPVPPAIEALPVARQTVLPFRSLSADELLAVGVPVDWTSDVQGASEDRFFELAEHLPAEAAEALLDYVGTGRLRRPAPEVPADPFTHPDALRRFRVVDNQEALALALGAPWEQWAVFLCQSASKKDPLSASKRDPLSTWFDRGCGLSRSRRRRARPQPRSGLFRPCS